MVCHYVPPLNSVQCEVQPQSRKPQGFCWPLTIMEAFPKCLCLWHMFAGGLVAHVNLRVPDKLLFKPFEGRLAEPINENVEASGHGNHKVHLPWLVDKLENPESNARPITGSREHYVLYDKFHKANMKTHRMCSEGSKSFQNFRPSLNSQVAEQLFASLWKNNCFLNNMGPSAHIFLMRNILEHKNSQQNEKLPKHQLRRGLQLQQLHSITLSDLGQVILG